MRRPKRTNRAKESSAPELLGEVLGRLFIARGWGRRLERLRLEQAWAEAAGPKVAAATCLGRLHRGVLEVIVGNSIVLQELAHFQKRPLLEALRARSPTPVTGLRFRIGAVAAPKDDPMPPMAGGPKGKEGL